MAAASEAKKSKVTGAEDEKITQVVEAIRAQMEAEFQPLILAVAKHAADFSVRACKKTFMEVLERDRLEKNGDLYMNVDKGVTLTKEKAASAAAALLISSAMSAAGRKRAETVPLVIEGIKVAEMRANKRGSVAQSRGSVAQSDEAQIAARGSVTMAAFRASVVNADSEMRVDKYSEGKSQVKSMGTGSRASTARASLFAPIPDSKSGSSTDLEAAFAVAQQAFRAMKDLDDNNKLLAYAHFKQATIGNVVGERPSGAKPPGKAGKVETYSSAQWIAREWDAWKNIEGMDNITATRRFCELVDELKEAELHDQFHGRAADGAEAEDLEVSFAMAQRAFKIMPEPLEEDRLRLIAHFKQATLGPAVGARPHFSAPSNGEGVSSRAKRGSAQWNQSEYDAWAKLETMDQATAKRMFCALMDQFKPGWRREEQSKIPPSARGMEEEPSWKREAREAGWMPKEDAEMEVWTDPAREFDAASSVGADSRGKGSRNSKGKGKRRSQPQADIGRPSFLATLFGIE